MKITAQTDAKALAADMARFRTITGKEITESLKAHARLACMYLSERTQPFSNTAKAEAQGINRVSKDIDKVYYTHLSESFYNQASNIAIRWYYAQEANTIKSEAQAIVERRYSDVRPTKSRGDQIAAFQARFKAYQQSNNITALGTIARHMKFKNVLFDTFDSGYHKRSRGPNGRVEGDVERVLVLGADNELQTYKTKKQELVGLSKAGWAKCAEAIPITGRVSSNVREAPAWVKRNIGRAMGHIQNNSNHPTQPHVVMTNATPWASRVIPPKEAQKALDKAQENFQLYMLTTIAKTLRETKLARAA